MKYTMLNMIMLRHVSPFTYSKKNVLVFFIVSVIAIAITLSPAITLSYLSFDESFLLVFIANFLIALFVYFFYLRSVDGFKITPMTNVSSLIFSAIVLLIILLVQYAICVYRESLYHYEPAQINLIAFMVASFVVPYYEEIIYRGCIFGCLYSVFNKSYLIPCILTSLIFCLMHGQYYNVLDQAILFMISILLLMVRIKSRGLFYPIAIHSCMNVFVLSSNYLSGF
ncbi:CPBP family intramembrane metalloprotease [Enterobacter cancerogenus]|jgi:uncharacterized protein|uniref:CPBP family intramembrane metalloprotease n=3 Tax=Enterobacter cancerogenus TaxID=69218 RepID=A0ABX8KKS9_9ENTR|nr:type II CAAX endopeptidase family protein [Enterobacter cancerogenus]QXA49719.1 CPBP family intramembrane metalloprotease [Enterobacter cancerogenus]